MTRGQLPLILASASARRADLLRAAGIVFEVRSADVDETVLAGESPEGYVRRVAEAKARAVAATAPGRAVVAADTVVVVDGAILGKPRDASDARRMLGLLSGRTHVVLTGVCVAAEVRLPPSPLARLRRPGKPDPTYDTEVRLKPDTTYKVAYHTEVCATTVEFAPLTAGDIDWYVATGEPMDKAGAYAVQGLASRFVTRIEGSYSNVVGLPVALVWRMCTEAGILVS